MYGISKRSKDVPKAIENIRKIFVEGEIEDLEDVPDELKNFSAAIEESEKDIENVEKKSEKIIDTMDEAIEALVLTKRNHETKLSELGHKIDTNLSEVEALEYQIRSIEKEIEDLTSLRNEAKAEYEKFKSDEDYWNKLIFWGQVGVAITGAGVAAYSGYSKGQNLAGLAGLGLSEMAFKKRYDRMNGDDPSESLKRREADLREAENALVKSKNEEFEKSFELSQKQDKSKTLLSEKMSQEEIIKSLSFVIKVFGLNVRNTWNAYHELIQKIKVDFTTSTNSLLDFEKKSINFQDAQRNHKVSSLKKERFLDSCENALEKVEVIESIARVYFEVSKRQIQPILSGLRTCQTIDNAEEMIGINERMKKEVIEMPKIIQKVVNENLDKN